MTIEYDHAVTGVIQSDRAQQARVGFSMAIGVNPDAYAEARRVARRTGVPVDTALNLPAQINQQDAMQSVDFEHLAKVAPATASLLAEVDKARIAHDDIHNLGLVETLVNSFRRGWPALKSVGPAIQVASQASDLGLYQQIDERIEAGESPRFVLSDYRDYRLLPLFAQHDEQILANWQAFKAQHLPGTQSKIANSAVQLAALQKQRSDIPLPGVVDRVLSAKTWGAALSGIARDPFKFIAAIGPESLVQSLPGLLAAIPAGIATGPGGVAATMGVNSFVVDFAGSLIGAMNDAGIDTTNPEAIRAGLKDPKALAKITEEAVKHATIVAGFDALSGGIAGQMLLPSSVAGKLSTQPFAKEMANIALQAPIQGTLGGAGELGGQIYSGQEIKPGEVLAEVFGEFFGTPIDVVSASAGRLRQTLQKVKQAEESTAALSDMGELASASKVLARDPETFEQFVASAAKSGPVDHIYIDAQTLMQSGVAEQVAAVSPAVAEQLQVALETGGQIHIPVEKYAARIAPTEHAHALLDHLKTEPEGFTRAEAQDYMQTQSEHLRQEVEQVLVEKEKDAAFKQSVEAVRTEIKAQLETAARFTSHVNDAYSSMVSQFYAVMAARLGMAPEALYQRYPLKIQAESVISAQDFHQASREIEKALDLSRAEKGYTGHHKIMPVTAEEIQQANAHGLNIEGFTHAIDGSAIQHIFKNHGNPEVESKRGQIAVTEEDIKAIPSILAAPDKMVYGLKNKIGRDMIVYLKTMSDGTTVYLEEVRTGKKTLTTQSMRRYDRTTHATSILKSLRPTSKTLPENASKISIVDTSQSRNFYEQEARGAYSPDRLTISLLKNADLSTFLHESGHFFLETLIDMVGRTDAPAEIQQDMAAVFKWLNVQDLKTWSSLSFEEKRSAHEQFARGFEAYLFEGKAPNIELQGLFQRFRAWMVNVYRELKKLNVELSDEVRGVFDRLLATNEQIALMEQGRSMLPLFASPEQAGMTTEEFAAYQSLGVDATNQAIEDLQARGLRDMKWLHNARGRVIKQLQKEVKARRDEVRQAVRDEVMSQPIYQAWQFLTSKNEEPGVSGKLSLFGMHDLYAMEGNQYALLDWKRLRDKRMVAQDGGLHPDVVAELFGFTSGDELVRKLVAAETPNNEIEALTDVRMLEQYGDLVSPEAIEQAADKAIHNDIRARMVATEANALAQATGQRKVLASAAKEYARAMIDRLKIRSIKPGQYANAEARAAKAAEKAAKKGDIATAAAEKRNQLIQNYATRAAYDAQEEVDAGLRYLKKFEGQVKSLDVDYQEQIDSLLDRFDLRKGQSLMAIDKRQTLVQWLEKQREQGFEPDIPQALEDEAYRTSYKNLTLEEFRGLVDSVKMIAHLGRLKKRLLTAKDQRDFELVRTEMIASIEDNARGRVADTRTPTTNLGRTITGLKRFWAEHIKAATWARIMDGGKDGGPMWEYFIRAANEAGDAETVDRAHATQALSDILTPVMKQGKMGGKGVFFPGINRSLNKEARLTIALNTGNESNLQRLLGGEGWTMQQLEPVLHTLTQAEWKAVQAIWDHFESYRPRIAAKEKRIYGKEPKWVEPRAVEVRTADGEELSLKGGYYPIKYDPSASERAESFADAEVAKHQLQGAFTSATTRRSFTKSRVEEVLGRPLLYTLEGLYSGVNDVIHDLSWHEWLIDANRLLRSKRLDSAIRSHYGPEAKRQLKTWVQDVAQGERGATQAGEAMAARIRQNVSVAGLGFNLVSALIQPLGITQSIVRVGAPWIGRGITKYIASPIQSTRDANEKSAFMALRARTRFRELNEIKNKVRGDHLSFIKENAYVLMLRTQQMVDVPTWHGAYEKAIAEGNVEERSIALADQAVIDSQGAGMTKDLSAIERGGPVFKMFTVFYMFFNTSFNLGVAQTMTATSKAKLASDYLLLFMVPAVLDSALRASLTPGADKDNDNDLGDLAKKLIAANLSFMMSQMVFLRELSDAAQIMAGVSKYQMDYKGPTGVRLLSDVTSLAKQVNQGEFDDAFRKAMINTAGSLFGLPSAQINRTITGTQALMEDKTANPLSIGFGFDARR